MLTRRPRYQRVDADAMELQPADIALLQWIHTCRFLTSLHLQAVDGRSGQVVLRRLQKLFHHGYLCRIRQQNNEVMIYALGNRGAEELRCAGAEVLKVNWDKKNAELKDRYNIQHELMIGDFRITMDLALRERQDVTLSALSRDTRQIIPDWPFTLIDGRVRGDFFLEADRSTMTTGDYLSKLKAYWRYWTETHDPFRVLTVSKSADRTRNLRTIARHAYDEEYGARMFWFTTAGRYGIETPASLFEPIWQTPADDTTHHLLE